MNNIVNGLFWNHRFKDMYGSLLRKMNLNEADDYEELGNKLFELNGDAVTQRYPEDHSDYVQVHRFKWVDQPVKTIQFLKSVQCLIYQCSEGDVPETELYKWLTDLENCLKSFVIEQYIPEYHKAEWS